MRDVDQAVSQGYVTRPFYYLAIVDRACQRGAPAGLASGACQRGLPLIAGAHDEAIAIRVGIGANITANV